MLIGLAFMAVWTFLAGAPSLLEPEIGAEGALRARRAAVIGPVVYGLSIPLAFVSPVTCLIVYAAMALYFAIAFTVRSEEHTSELQSPCNLVCRLLLEKTRELVYLVRRLALSRAAVSPGRVQAPVRRSAGKPGFMQVDLSTHDGVSSCY